MWRPGPAVAGGRMPFGVLYFPGQHRKRACGLRWHSALGVCIQGVYVRKVEKTDSARFEDGVAGNSPSVSQERRPDPQPRVFLCSGLLLAVAHATMSSAAVRARWRR
jgi:hypothetical protein